MNGGVTVEDEERRRAATKAPAWLLAIVLAALASLASPLAVRAAEVELIPSVGGIAGGAVSTRQGDLTLDPGFAVGLGLAWRVRYDGLIEIAYARQDTRIELESAPGRTEFRVSLPIAETNEAGELR